MRWNHASQAFGMVRDAGIGVGSVMSGQGAIMSGAGSMMNGAAGLMNANKPAKVVNILRPN